MTRHNESLYFFERQADSSYTIKATRFGSNSEIVETGVRGCNVSRRINTLYTNDMQLSLPLGF